MWRNLRSWETLHVPRIFPVKLVPRYTSIALTNLITTNKIVIKGKYFIVDVDKAFLTSVTINGRTTITSHVVLAKFCDKVMFSLFI